jgi:hypothetical protein
MFLSIEVGVPAYGWLCRRFPEDTQQGNRHQYYKDHGDGNRKTGEEQDEGWRQQFKQQKGANRAPIIPDRKVGTGYEQ